MKCRGPARVLPERELHMNSDCCDRTLVLRAQSGERPAFNALVRKYRPRVLKLAMRYMRNRADAEDAVQETFMKAYWGLQRFRGDSAFYSWLHRIAVNSAKTALSLRARHSGVFSAAGSADELSDTGAVLKDMDTPEQLALTDEICGAVNAAIDALGDEQRTAIVLREFEGFTYLQVASAMSCPVGTVRSRVFRAREAIDSRLRYVFDDVPGGARNNPTRQPRQICEWAAPPAQEVA
jgi:RNA polymerase sigma-70 factor (ECF subfamily)